MVLPYTKNDNTRDRRTSCDRTRQPSIYNQEMIKTVARGFGFDVKIITRSRDGTQGVAVIINERWAKIPSTTTEYNLAEEYLNTLTSTGQNTVKIL